MSSPPPPPPPPPPGTLRRASFSRTAPYLPPPDDDSDMDIDSEPDRDRDKGRRTEVADNAIALNTSAKARPEGDRTSTGPILHDAPAQPKDDDEVDELASDNGPSPDDDDDEEEEDNHPSEGESEVDVDERREARKGKAKAKAPEHPPAPPYTLREWASRPPVPVPAPAPHPLPHPLPPPSVLAQRPPQPPLPAGTFQSPPGHLSLEYQRQLSILALEKERERRERRGKRERKELREDVWGVSPGQKRKELESPEPPRAAHPSLPLPPPPPLHHHHHHHHPALPTQSHPHHNHNNSHKAYPQQPPPQQPPTSMFGVLKSVPVPIPIPAPTPTPPARSPSTTRSPTQLRPAQSHSHSHSHSGSPWLYAGEEPYDEDEDGYGYVYPWGVGRAGAEGRDDVEGEGEAEGEGRPKKRRRTRVALSCAECKRRKIKCDRAQPCTPCARRGDQSNCKWAVMETKDGAPTRAEFDALQVRLAHVERLLFALPPNPNVPNPNGIPPPAPAPATSTGKFRAHPIPRAHSTAGGGAGGGAGAGAGSHASGSGFATNGPVFPPPAPMAPAPRGHETGSGSGTRNSPIKIEEPEPEPSPDPSPSREERDGPGPEPASSRPTLRLLPEALRPPSRISGTTFPLSDADWEQMTSVALTGANKQRPEAGSMHVDVQRELEALVGTLPGKESCDRVWGCYVDRLEWQHCVVHPGAFQQMYDTFWAFKTHAERAACTPIAWLALLLIVMSHGLATMRPAEARASGIAEDTAHWRMLCTQLWIASERALALDNFSHAVTLEVVQTLVLLSYRAISLDPKGWFHQAPILAMAIRLAMCIGLSNVVGDKTGEVPPPGLYRRELWRRIWFNIVYLDWRFSVPMGETYFINSYHYNTVQPANLDWSDMADGTVFRPKPRGAFTSSSMFLAKVHNADRVRELCDALNVATRGGQQDVSRLFYEHEVSVNDTIALEPQCLIEKDEAMESADKRVQWARIGHTLELDYRAIQIHRSFLVADFREARARAVCVDTAEKMLDCFAEGKVVDAPSAWWWYGYTACVVLMMEQYYADLQPAADVAKRLNQRLDNIMSYVAMQRSCEEVTVRAWDGILILETLIAELQKRRIAAAGHPTNPASRNRAYDQIEAPAQTVTRVSSSSPVHAFRKWILNVMPFLKLPSVPGLPVAHPRQRDMDAAFWDAILDIDTELHKSSRRGNFGKS